MIQEFFLLIAKKFQLTAARRRLADKSLGSFAINTFQLTAARRRLDARRQDFARIVWCFNSQPPEGGWWCFP